MIIEMLYLLGAGGVPMFSLLWVAVALSWFAFMVRNSPWIGGETWPAMKRLDPAAWLVFAVFFMVWPLFLAFGMVVSLRGWLVERAALRSEMLRAGFKQPDGVA